MGNKLVIDIETAGKNLVDFDEISREYFEHWAENAPGETEEELKKIEEGFSFSPLSAEVVCIGALNPDTDKGFVYYQNGGAQSSDGAGKKEFEENGIQFEAMNEKAMLLKFWEQIKFYDEFITFNGRGFDIPFLMIRSAIHRVKPSKNLLSNRYLNLQRGQAKHIDLLDQMQFYGATYGKRGYNLHMFCKAFGIASPKTKGVDGAHVKDMFNKGEYEKIARYNVDDIVATAELYRRWKEYLDI